MTPLAHAALLAAVACGVLAFRKLPGHRAIAIVYVVGILFLPEMGYSDAIAGVPPPINIVGIKLTKTNAIAVGLLLGSLLHDWRRWLTAQTRWFDLPMMLWCVGPVISSVANSLIYDDPVARAIPVRGGVDFAIFTWLDGSDLYDGMVRSIDVVLTWGVPYCLGRLYITDVEKLTEIVLVIIAATLLYLPLCLMEMLLSPQLHRWIYGFHQHEFIQSMRLGGYRPMVFMQHGLALGFWLIAAALLAIWMWVMGPLREVPHPLKRGSRVSGLWIIVPLVTLALLCKSVGAIVLGVIGLSLLFVGWYLRSRLPILILLAVPLAYVALRTDSTLDTQGVVSFASDMVGAERADSLQFRFRNETAIIDRAMERPLIGWGGWGRWQVRDRFGKLLTVADGLWVITLGERGMLGLATLGLVMLLPCARSLVFCRSLVWSDPRTAVVFAVTMVLALYAIDCLLNAMVNPVYFILSGSLIALTNASISGPQQAASQEAVRWRIQAKNKLTRCLGVNTLKGSTRAITGAISRSPSRLTSRQETPE